MHTWSDCTFCVFIVHYSSNCVSKDPNQLTETRQFYNGYCNKKMNWLLFLRVPSNLPAVSCSFSWGKPWPSCCSIQVLGKLNLHHWRDDTALGSNATFGNDLKKKKQLYIIAGLKTWGILKSKLCTCTKTHTHLNSKMCNTLWLNKNNWPIILTQHLICWIGVVTKPELFWANYVLSSQLIVIQWGRRRRRRRRRRDQELVVIDKRYLYVLRLYWACVDCVGSVALHD